MSLYNMINGVTGATFIVLPMLDKHPDEYPRFRDCFLSDDEYPEYDGKIQIYTRTGGGNREGYAEQNEAMREMPGFITDFDDSFDSTFASWVFEVPEKWKKDFDLIGEGRHREVSNEYKENVKTIYPKISEKIIDALFENQKE